jgi:hypothetical protein
MSTASRTLCRFPLELPYAARCGNALSYQPLTDFMKFINISSPKALAGIATELTTKRMISRWYSVKQ